MTQIHYNYDILPQEIWSIVAEYLLPKHIITLSMTSKTLYSYMTDDNIIRQRLFELFNMVATSVFKSKKYPIDLKKYF